MYLSVEGVFFSFLACVVGVTVPPGLICPGGDAPAEGAPPRQHRQPAGSGVSTRWQAIRCPGESRVTSRSHECWCPQTTYIPTYLAYISSLLFCFFHSSGDTRLGKRAAPHHVGRARKIPRGPLDDMFFLCMYVQRTSILRNKPPRQRRCF